MDTSTPDGELIGRDAKVQQVLDLVEGGARCVTLLGPGGIGKTSVARACMKRRAAAATSPFFCDLTDADSANVIVGRVAQAIGLVLAATDAGGRELIAKALRGYDRPMLVLDNCEHVIADVARLIASLITETEVCVIATSREVLGLSRETRVDVGPLAQDDACRLFEQRARRVRPELEVVDEDRAVLVAIVEQLDRLPLAIELCAARVAVFTLSQLHERLRDRFALLISRFRDVPPRHATMRCVIETSWETLDEAQQRAFAECSVFRGGFTIAAAERVLSEHDKASWVVQQLVERSLLVSHPDPEDVRFGMLSTISHFATEKLGPDAAASARRRHAICYAGMARDLRASMRSGDRPHALHRLDDERANLRAAWAWARDHDVEHALDVALALHELLAETGPATEDLVLCEEALGLARDLGQAEPLAWAGWARARAMHRAGDPEGAYQHLSALLETEVVSATRPLRCAVTLEAGVAATARGELEIAEAHLRHALAELEAAGDRWGRATAMRYLGGSARYRGEIRQAVVWLDATVALAQELNDATIECAALIDLAATTAVHPDEKQRAEPAFARALALAHELGDARTELLAAGGLAFLAQTRRANEEAGTLWRRSLALARRGGRSTLIAYAASGLANWCREVGDTEAAARHFDEALSEAKSVPHVYVMHELLLTYASFLADRDRIAEAREQIARARELMEVQPGSAEAHLHRVAESFVTLAEVRRDRGDDVAARIAATRDVADQRANLPLVVDVRLLRAAIATTELAVGLTVLTIGSEGTLFSLTDGAVMSLEKHRVLPRLLRCLAHHHAANSTPVATEELIAAGWPSEKILPAAASQRLRVAISTLRKLGLADVLLHQDGGYLLDPAILVRFESAL